MSKNPVGHLEPIDGPDERLCDETCDYIIFVETYPYSGTVTGMDQRYGILNKMTGVVELRFGTYGEALQGLLACQEHYDRFMIEYKRKMGMLN